MLSIYLKIIINGLALLDTAQVTVFLETEFMALIANLPWGHVIAMSGKTFTSLINHPKK